MGLWGEMAVWTDISLEWITPASSFFVVVVRLHFFRAILGWQQNWAVSIESSYIPTSSSLPATNGYIQPPPINILPHCGTCVTSYESVSMYHYYAESTGYIRGLFKKQNINTKENLPKYLHYVATNNFVGYYSGLTICGGWGSVLSIYIFQFYFPLPFFPPKAGLLLRCIE